MQAGLLTAAMWQDGSSSCSLYLHQHTCINKPDDLDATLHACMRSLASSAVWRSDSRRHKISEKSRRQHTQQVLHLFVVSKEICLTADLLGTEVMGSATCLPTRETLAHKQMSHGTVATCESSSEEASTVQPGREFCSQKGDVHSRSSVNMMSRSKSR